MDVICLPGVIICNALLASFGQKKRYIRTAYYDDDANNQQVIEM